jgi:ankyrin repeat protein
MHNAKPSFLGHLHKPIHLASADGNVNIVKLLMSKGVDIKAENDDGRQPIHFSSQYGNDDVICLLSWNGADVNAKDNSGKGPLHYACHKHL